MKTENELNDDILEIQEVIKDTFPELLTYIKKTPVNISNTLHTEMNIQQLKLYYQSLDLVLRKYFLNHPLIAG